MQEDKDRIAQLLPAGVAAGHPHLDAETITTTEMAVRGTLKVVMAALALVGLTGMYLRQVRQTGLLGLIGYAVYALGYLLISGTAFAATFILPSVAETDPGFVNDVLAVATNSTPSSDIGPLQIFIQGGGFAYVVGGIIFGIALFRANVLARWAAMLLSIGAVAILTTSQLPELTQRLFAIPVSVALIGLGFSLWREQRPQYTRPMASPVSSQLDPTGAK